jgi:hypothetical protein
MDSNWQMRTNGSGSYGYGWHPNAANYPYGYGNPSNDDKNTLTANGSGGAQHDDQLVHGTPVDDHFGHGQAYGAASGSGSGFGNGRSNDYDAAGYGSINRDETHEDGHGDGGMYESEAVLDQIYYYHTYHDFNAYGGQDS